MYPDWVLLAPGWMSLIGLGLIGFFIWQDRKYLTSLFPKSGERDIRKKFEETVRVIEEFEGRLGQLDKRIGKLETNALVFTQRVELLRYNPYEDTGGDQSFSVALLDRMGNGVIVTSLHTRSGTRVFAKPVKSGKAEKYQFSSEEEQVVKKAMVLKID